MVAAPTCVPPFNRVAELEADGEQIAGICYLTDLDAWDRIPTESDIPVLWLCTSDKEGPFGRTVKVEIKP